MRRKKKPAYLLHPSTGQARVRINGRDIYLGKYGSPESREEYDRQIARWFSGQSDLPAVSIDDLCLPLHGACAGPLPTSRRIANE